MIPHAVAPGLDRYDLSASIHNTFQKYRWLHPDFQGGGRVATLVETGKDPLQRFLTDDMSKVERNCLQKLGVAMRLTKKESQEYHRTGLNSAPLNTSEIKMNLGDLVESIGNFQEPQERLTSDVEFWAAEQSNRNEVGERVSSWLTEQVDASYSFNESFDQTKLKNETK
jgi:hypothetical protein